MNAIKRLGFVILPILAVSFFFLSRHPFADAAEQELWPAGKGGGQTFIDPAFNEAMTQLVKKTLPAVVSIAVETKMRFNRRGTGGRQLPLDDFFEYFFHMPNGQMPKRQGMGSGFIINPDGYILTNNHVVEEADEITVELGSDEEYPAKIIGRDPLTDLALLKIEAGHPLPYLLSGDSDALEIGHIVIAMGNPLGLSHTVTQGIVSQKGRTDIAPSGRQIYANFIQTDASINPGNSGGPLLNINGEVVGINTAIAQGQGIGFAIPVNMARRLLPQLGKGKVERSWIGIRVQRVTPELADSLGLERPHGALVAKVVEGSPAEKAGLKEEDVLLEFDGKPLRNEADLRMMASTAGVGHEARLKVWRGGRSLELSMKLGLMPGEDEDGVGPASGSGQVEALGIQVADPDEQARKQGGITDGLGALVVAVDEKSPARRTGLRPGDIIRKLGGTRIKNAAHFKKVAKKIRKGEAVRLLINRQGNAIFIAFRIY